MGNRIQERWHVISHPDQLDKGGMIRTVKAHPLSSAHVQGGNKGTDYFDHLAIPLSAEEAEKCSQARINNTHNSGIDSRSRLIQQFGKVIDIDRSEGIFVIGTKQEDGSLARSFHRQDSPETRLIIPPSITFDERQDRYSPGKLQYVQKMARLASFDVNNTSGEYSWWLVDNITDRVNSPVGLDDIVRYSVGGLRECRSTQVALPYTVLNTHDSTQRFIEHFRSHTIQSPENNECGLPVRQQWIGRVACIDRNPSHPSITIDDPVRDVRIQLDKELQQGIQSGYSVRMNMHHHPGEAHDMSFSVMEVLKKYAPEEPARVEQQPAKRRSALEWVRKFF